LMTGLVIGMAMLASAGGPPADSATVGTAAVTAPSVERVAQPPAPLKLPTDLVYEQPHLQWRAEAARASQSTSTRQSSTAAKVIGITVGAVGGFYAGGIIGGRLTEDKNADDDGVSALRGIVIGAPVGALIGALIGWQVAK
jgi:hypothetical protein